MILKAFSEYIKQFDENMPANVLLVGWLKNKLSKEPADNVDNVIHQEIALISDENCNVTFIGKSPSGKRLLDSLYNFADSYEQQKFTRWVHGLKPSDFHNFIKE